MFKKFALIAAGLGLGLLTACALVSPEASFARTHPQELSAGRPSCTECHGTERVKSTQKTFASLDHTTTFVKDHKVQATQDGATCASCHAQSFCSDCHGGKTAMLPSAKLGNRPDRLSPHRTGYLTMHRIDGKVDPTGCFKCHGRANNEKCTACHK
ncbi:hypothetical protein [Geothrix sp. 21YS21S-2]|uniref:hypothetical protein n=1 Tax=Geothrix sp. 21YS21S-2 TaxID=3068893 RepID=UPI0027B9ACD6|nr:hypothetical protein [Geothrix sp. 21YS21S-2]